MPLRPVTALPRHAITILRTSLRGRNLVAWGAAFLGLCYAWAYLRYPELPGTRPGFPNGWWDWFDQSKTLQSTIALAHGDFSPVHHWYPLGYALLGAPFARPVATHAFFFVDLASLVLAFVAFCRFAGHAGISRGWSVGIFLAGTLASRQIFDQWAIPWNTTPPAALTWLLLALLTSARRGVLRALVIGFVAGCIPLFRPTDIIIAAAGLGAALLGDFFHGPATWRVSELGWIIAGAAVPVLAYACLYLVIYGPQPTDYMRQSRALGFTLYDFGWKAYVILVDPRPWFGGGDGLLRRCPWIALTIAGIIPALRRGRGCRILVSMLAAHAFLYLSYVDLLPSGFWRFDNVHYWTWAMPGYALLAFALLADVVRGGARRWIAAGCTVATVFLLCVHLDPVAAAADAPAKLLVFPGMTAKFDDVYSAPVGLRDEQGLVRNVYAMRIVPAEDGLRAIALRRDFAANAAWESGHAPGNPASSDTKPTRWRIAVSLGWPCWLPRSCRASP